MIGFSQFVAGGVMASCWKRQRRNGNPPASSGGGAFGKITLLKSAKPRRPDS